MPLQKLTEFDPNYRDSFEGHDLKGLGVYTEENNDKIGSVTDVLVDDEGHFRYFVVDLGFWIFGKKVLLPVGRSRIDYNAERVYAVGMNRQQAEDLPEFNERQALDYDYEEKVRGVYRNPLNKDYTPPVEASAPLTAAAPLEALGTFGGVTTGLTDTVYNPTITPNPVTDKPINPAYDRNTYNYQEEPALYNLNEQDHQTFKLYEERLIANKRRQKTGEVTIGKHIETDTARVAVPVEKERLVVERVTPTDAGKAVSPDATAFREGEVARVDLYEETPDIQKQTVLREEVRVSKVVDKETVQAQDTIRREELDVNSPNLPIEEG